MPRMIYARLASTTTLITLMSLGTARADPTIGPMTDLGSLDGNNSEASTVSADGSVIVGWAKTGNGRRSGHVVSWVNGATSPTDLGTLGGGYSAAQAVSADGRVIVG